MISKNSNRFYFFIVLFAAIQFMFVTNANAQHYYSVPEILTYLFPKSDKVDFEKKYLSNTQIQSIRKDLKTSDVMKDWTVYVAHTKNNVDGYAIIDNVFGKEKPITYVVSISPTGEVKEVELLEYRESHGGQVKNKAFRNQFVGKMVKDPIKIGQDIQHVSGATISSKSIAFGVKRALAVWNALYNSPS